MARSQKKPQLRRRIENLLYSTPVELLVYSLIIMSVALIAIEVSDIPWVEENKAFLEISEMVFIIFFSVEYILKFVIAKDKWVFFRRYFIDLLAILPFLRIFRLFRGFRILRLLRVVRLLRLGNMVARQISRLEGAKNVREVIIILVVFLSTVLAGSIGILMFEKDIPDTHFENLGDGLWWCFVTITTVGYGDKYPQTGEGRILGGVIMLVGLSFYGLVSGLGSNYIIHRFKKGSDWMVSTFQNHTVILGVNDKIGRLVELLLDMGHRLVIITDDMDRLPHYPEHLVVILEGDFVSEKLLHKARIEEASYAIILADTEHRRSQEADARSILASMAIEKLHPEIVTVVEAMSDDAKFHLEHAAVNDIVSSGALTSEMLAFSVGHPGYSQNLYSLLRFVHQNRISSYPAAPSQIGRKMFELQIDLAMEQKIFIGIQRDGEDIMRSDTIVQKDDILIVVEIL